jgi:hypothetical protein
MGVDPTAPCAIQKRTFSGGMGLLLLKERGAALLNLQGLYLKDGDLIHAAIVAPLLALQPGYVTLFKRTHLSLKGSMPVLNHPQPGLSRPITHTLFLVFSSSPAPLPISMKLLQERVQDPP